MVCLGILKENGAVSEVRWFTSGAMDQSRRNKIALYERSLQRFASRNKEY